ncbi:MAG: translation initiation factor IF-2 [Defluviitaleaceae bacterium]|nr:translation initiation factor IF-2 [Defluviitaleaceae bacterium]
MYDKDKDLDKDKKTATKSSSSKNTPVIEGAKPAVANRRFTNKPKQNLFSKNTKKKGGNDEAQITATQRKKDKRKIKKRKEEEELLAAQAAAKAAENDIKTIKIAGSITVGELANKLGKGIQEIISPLMKIGIMASINQEIDFYTAAKIAEEFDILVEPLEQINILEEAFGKIEDKEEDLKPRPPVVVVMGHVDHGKTSLLDAIRKSHVADGEAGGITQRIGAYQVDINEKTITFLDTPGHEAFTAMRMRGAQVTDIAILVVAADDGVMPQTVEAINHAKAAEVEIIVAINKIDKDGANMDRVKQELSEHGIVPEDWGGSVVCVPVSAKKRIGIDDLLEATLLVSELKELKANPNKRAMGTVIEANLDKGKGPVATVLVQEGSLTISEPIVIGATHGRVRAMIDHKGNRVKKVGPSTPVEIVGLGSVPKAGDILYVANSEKQAAQVASSMVEQTREEMIKQRAKISLDDLFNQIKDGKIKELNLIIKADVQGSVEAVRNSLERLSNEEVKIRIVHSGAGQVTESDIMLASTSSAIIIAFNVNYDATAKQIADEQKVDVRLYSVIYNAIEDISNAMKGMLDPIFEEKIIGHAEIRQLFKASGTAIAGSYVTDGKISRNSKVRLLRNGKIVHDGELLALKRFKDDVKEVATGYECGISFNKYNDLLEGDIVEAYVMEEVTR